MYKGPITHTYKPLSTQPPSTSMGRPASAKRQKKWKVSIDAALAGAVELRLLDPLHKKPAYGKRSELIEQLLSDWLDKEKSTENA